MLLHKEVAFDTAGGRYLPTYEWQKPPPVERGRATSCGRGQFIYDVSERLLSGISSASTIWEKLVMLTSPAGNSATIFSFPPAASM